MEFSRWIATMNKRIVSIEPSLTKSRMIKKWISELESINQRQEFNLKSLSNPIGIGGGEIRKRLPSSVSRVVSKRYSGNRLSQRFKELG